MMATIIPAATSSGKCWARYILEYPTKMAVKITTGRHHFFLVIKQIIRKKVNAVAVCPDGKLENECTVTPSTV